ncbi:alpha/beta fold hydrolase [Halobacteriovorax sp. HLS]|uniref:alpha/beta fold hydrolase n=1 Tax=Halobacteriovorax sp. HLS TaxID=2234000 RepID=UPI000FD81F8E|nr:alpha/beta hydrolase [Halobacteriovorax sp. HLS]
MKYLLCLIILLSQSCAVLVSDKAYDKELSSYEYPFEVLTYEFSSQRQNLKMRYMDLGDKSSSKVTVLLHGKNFSGYYWERIAKELVAKGHRVIIPDQIGFGKSSKPEHYQYSFGQLSLNTKGLLDSLKIEKFNVVGHSMGGMLAVTMVDQFSKSVDKLILINPIGLEAYSDYVQYKDISFYYKNELNKTLVKARNYQKKNYYDGKWSAEYEKLLVPLDGQLKGNDWEVVAWNNALTYGPIFSENIVAKFPKIKRPTYLVIGSRDKTGPGRGWKKDGEKRVLGQYAKLAKNAHKLIPGSKLYLLDGLGHMPQYENYEAFSKVFYPIFK